MTRRTRRDPGGPWNLNIADDARLDRLVPLGAQRVLDVGCGDGFLSARLAERIPEVVGLDVDPGVLQRAQERFPEARVRWTLGDVREAPLTTGSFDAVVSNATLHHLGETGAALSRLGDLVRPGGRLALTTFTRLSARDLPWQASAWVWRGVALRRRRKWEHSAPQHWPPADDLAGLRHAARQALPGSRVQRLPHGRVLLVWDRPGAA